MAGGGDRSPPESSTGIYTYEAPWKIYAMNWSDTTHRLAIASHLDGYPNRVEVVHLDDYAGEIRSDPNLSFDHHYPPTKAMFVPDLLATSADFLRLWRVSGDRAELAAVLDGNRGGEFCGPITSFDWDEADTTRICTASIDTTCTVWDAERAAVDTQLVAHDGEVYDVAWGWPEVFASVSGDGSLRIFDLRDKEHSTILYQSSCETPVRLAWNRLNPRYIAAVIMESPKVVVFDFRYPMLPIVEVQHHRSKQAGINAIAWAPHSSCHICTAGEDSQALIWDLSSMGGGAASGADGGLEPILAYMAGAEIEQLQWSLSQPDWVAIAFSNKLQILRV